MRAVLVLPVLALIAAPALAGDIARSPDVEFEGTYVEHQDQIGDAEHRGLSLVASVTAGLFTDLGPAYVAALDVVGAGPADLIYDPGGVWPPLGGYQIVLVSMSDTWWSGYFLEADEAVLASFIDSGGCFLLVGQDYLYARGFYTGFPMTHLGLGSVYEDANYEDYGTMNYDGTFGGPLNGVSGSMAPCFLANPWFTDDVTPAVQGLVTWTTPAWGPAEGGCVLGNAGLSTVEFACDGANLANAMSGIFYNLCYHITPVETTSWGAIRGLFR